MPMTVNKKIAIDTNILLYSLDDYYPEKQTVARGLLAQKPYLCTQNLSKFINVLSKRWKYSKLTVMEIVEGLLEICHYQALPKDTIILAEELVRQYNFQYFDSLIVASALENDCNVLYSEDMQHKLIVEKTLGIINPLV
jgi:predicted nucleic acid-binding protein